MDVAMKKLLPLGILLVFAVEFIRANDTIFYEGFEHGILPNGWDELKVKGKPNSDIVNWKYTQYSYMNSAGIVAWPDTVAKGHYVARFDYQSDNKEATKLIMPPQNLNGRTKVVLSFWHAQAAWTWDYPTWDILRLYYKRGADSSWKILEMFEDAVNSWTKREILLPDSILSSTFYIAFEATTNYGFGVCIDEVRLIETGVMQRSIGIMKLSKPYLGFAATGTNKNRILRFDIQVNGNTGSKLLQSLNINSLNTSDADIISGGVRVFYTSDTLFNDKILLGSGSFSSGTASVNLSNYTLNTGNNSIWITYDVAANATPNDYLDAAIQSNSLSISNSTYPSSDLSVSGKRIIRQSLLYDDFESGNNWTLSGFEINTPMGKGGNIGNNTWGAPDPASAYSGSKELGNDLVNTGNYANSLATAISPVFNCNYFKNVTLSFQRLLNVYGDDYAGIDISNDNGSTWTNVWNNNSVSISEWRWGIQVISLTNYADHKSQVKLRFRLQPSSSNDLSSGWNIDNFIIAGDYITSDVGVTQWLAPLTGCGLGSNVSVMVRIKNFTNVASGSIIPLKYSFDGIHFYFDTLAQSIPANGTYDFTFKHKMNLIQPNYYNNVVSSTYLSSDQDSRNDAIHSKVYSLPNYTVPYNDLFRSSTTFWIANSSAWGYGLTSSKFLLNVLKADTNAWITRIDYVNYFDNDSGYLESSCVDFSNAVKPIFEIKYNSNFEQNQDGVNLQYSTDNETSWHIVPKHDNNLYPWHWNWYSSDNIAALNAAGWDTTTNQWTIAKQVLPDDIAGKSSVRFRFHFASDAQNNFEGFAFDDVKIYEAPANIQLLGITSPSSACEKVNPSKISFKIKNIGIRTMVPAKDKIIAGFKINSSTAIVDTLTLPSSLSKGDSVVITFNKATPFLNSGEYDIMVFDIDQNQNFYAEQDNDTIIKHISIYSNPISGIGSLFKSARLDTLIISANVVANCSYTWKHGNTVLSDSLKLRNPPPGLDSLIMKYTIDTMQYCSTLDTFKVIKLISDIGINSVLSPSDTCATGFDKHVCLSVKNFGNDTIAKNDTIKIGYKFLYPDTVWHSIKLQNPFKPGETLIYVFPDSSVDMVSVKAYILHAYSFYKNDTISNNNDKDATVHVWGYPKINLGNDTTVVGSFVLHAGNTYSLYHWSDGSSDSTYNVRYTGIHWVQVSDMHSCRDTDSINVDISFHDVKPLALMSIGNSCSNDSLKNIKIKIKIKNVGTDNLVAGEHIIFSYYLNGIKKSSYDSTLTGTFNSGDSIIHEFSVFEDLSVAGNYIFKIIAHNDFDVYTENDTLRDTIVIYPNPVISLGPDTTVKALQYTLDAGAGANKEYLWQDNSTNQTLTITQSKTVHVTVTNTLHNCAGSDSANIIIEIRDGWLKMAIIDTAACKGTFDSVKVVFVNKGNISIQANDTIYFNYIQNDTIFVTDTLKLLDPLAAGDSIYFTFHNLRQVAFEGINKFDFYSLLKNDLIHSNDTLTRSIKIWPVPDFDWINGPDNTVTKTPPFLLEAPLGQDYFYYWICNTTDSDFTIKSAAYSTLNVLKTGYYSLTVTDTVTRCLKSDSLHVNIIIPDGGITNVNSVSQACIGDFNSAEVEFTNLGNTTLHKNDEILFVYELGLSKSPAIVERRRLNSDVHPGDTLMHTFSNLSQKVKIGMNKFKFYAIIGQDIHPENDTTFNSVTIYALPNVIIDNGKNTDTLVYGTILSPNLGTGYSYLWNDNSTGEKLKIDSTRLYFVTVNNNSTSCRSADSVFVNVLIPDGGITDIFIPSQGCYKTIDNLITEFTNIGNVDIPIGDTIRFSYITDKGATGFADTIIVASLHPGEKIVKSIPGLKDKLDLGSNTIKAFSVISKDSIPGNDTLSHTILINPLPSFQFVGEDSGWIISLPGKFIATTLGSPGYSVKWQNSVVSDSINVYSSGTYFTEVTDNTTLCKKTDSVKVKIRLPDGGITKVLEDSACENNFDKLNVIFTNLGDEKINAGSFIKFGYVLNGLPYPADSIYLQSGLNIGDTLYHTFVNLFGELKLGSNTFKVFSKLKEDVNSSNDTLVHFLKLNAYPFVNIDGGKNSLSCYPGTVIRSGLDSGFSFLWQDASSADTIITSASGFYRVTATNNLTGCKRTDSIDIKILIPDGSITAIYGNQSACEEQFGELSIEFTNTGNLNLLTGDTIFFGYILNSQQPVFEKEILSDTLYPGDKITHDFTGFNSNLQHGTNNVSFFSKIKIDIIPSDDTLKSILTINTYPFIALRENKKDTIYKKIPYTLDAGTNPGCSFLWQDNSDLQTFVAQNYDKYKVKVTNNTTGCSSIDSVYIFKPFIDGSITAINGKVNACQGEFGSLLAEYTNLGYTAIDKNDTIVFKLLINDKNELSDSVILMDTLKPSEQIVHVFIELDTILKPGLNKLLVIGITKGDTVYKNDSSTFETQIYPLPDLNIGKGQDTILFPPYTLTAGLGSGYAYLWQNTLTSETIPVFLNGKFKIIATNKATNCKASDSVNVHLDLPDEGIVSVKPDTPVCHNLFNQLIVRIQNVGEYKLAVKDTINIFIKINGSEVKNKVNILSSDIYPGNFSDFTITNLVSYIIDGTNIIQVYCKTKHDTNQNNDTLKYNLVINANPAINLANGEDTVKFSKSYSLDAGSGYKTYLWNTKATTHSITVTKPGWYNITVTDFYGCKAKDSVFMELLTIFTQLIVDENLKVYPNPAKDEIFVELDRFEIFDPLIEVLSNDMKIVFRKEVSGHYNNFKEKIDVQEWEKGLYYIRLNDKSENKYYFQKVIIQ